jgi:hypothetical protein
MQLIVQGCCAHSALVACVCRHHIARCCVHSTVVFVFGFWSAVVWVLWCDWGGVFWLCTSSSGSTNLALQALVVMPACELCTHHVGVLEAPPLL